MLTLILLVFAFALSCIAAFIGTGGTPVPHYPRLVAAALAFYFAACIFGDKIVSSHFGGN